jgi:hypothetical protein
MSSTMILPTKEQEMYGFMNRSFFPPWKTIETMDGLSEEISCFFMGGSGMYPSKKKEDKKGGEFEKIEKIEKKRMETMIPNQSIAPLPQEIKHDKISEKELTLDWRYWAFWTVWISFHGLADYHVLPEEKRLTVWREEKTKMSDWFQVNFLVAKKEISKRWDKMTNMDMEDAITGLVTDIDEQDSGLKTLLLCWTYYSMSMEDGKGAMECIWVVPGKSLYYSFSHGWEDSELSSFSSVEYRGVFMELLGSKGGGSGADKKRVEGAPPRKPLKKQKRFQFRALEKGEVESIRNTMIEIKAVNRPLAAISKYTLKELVDMGEKVGLRPPMISVLDEKGAMKLDLAEKVRESERELGVVRKTEEKKVLKKELEKVEKWKKGDWYERLEEYCLDVF